jgi:hypothetical protein
MEISGKVYQVMPVQSGVGKTGNEWRKIDFVVETDAKYDNRVCFTAWGERVADVENLGIGQKVKVSFDVASREYNEKWYTDIKAWKIDLEGEAQPQSSTSTSSGNASAPTAANNHTSSVAEDGGDDLPF